MVRTPHSCLFPGEKTSITSKLRDWPNSWPPHQYIALQALRSLPSKITAHPLPTPKGNQTTFDLIPPGQLGITAAQLFPQTIDGGTAFPVGADVNRLNGTIVNGGNATKKEGWAKVLERELSNRYITSALCNWCVYTFMTLEFGLGGVLEEISC